MRETEKGGRESQSSAAENKQVGSPSFIKNKNNAL